MSTIVPLNKDELEALGWTFESTYTYDGSPITELPLGIELKGKYIRFTNTQIDINDFLAKIPDNIDVFISETTVVGGITYLFRLRKFKGYLFASYNGGSIGKSIPIYDSGRGGWMNDVIPTLHPDVVVPDEVTLKLEYNITPNYIHEGTGWGFDYAILTDQ